MCFHSIYRSFGLMYVYKYILQLLPRQLLHNEEPISEYLSKLTANVSATFWKSS